jgi:MFS family permease
LEAQNFKTGLRQNWKQFSILVLVNAFVGGMIGMERNIFPQFAEFKFGLDSKLAILSFITSFGISKAFANYFAGFFANKIGRKKLLLFGWLLAIPVPFLLIHSLSWNWVIFSNILLGISQGLTWSSTVVMKIDLVGEKNRGFAMGLNEFAGYFALGLSALITGFIANKFGLSPYPFYLGIFISFMGLFITFFWVDDTRKIVQNEVPAKETKSLKNIFIETTFKNKTLSSITQAGLVNNLNDGMIWGLFPIFLFSLNYDNSQIGLISSVYPFVWGFGQLFTGKMADIYSKKYMLFYGMLLQALAIISIPFVSSFYPLILLSALLGIGTALVYPTFLISIAQITTPVQRAESIGTFRLWRDLGYAFGAILSGVVADFFGINYAIIFIGLITVISSIILLLRFP